MDVYIRFAGLSKFGKRELDYFSLIKEALEDAELKDYDFDRIEAIFIGSMNPSKYIGEGNIGAKVADSLGLKNVSSFLVDTASSSGASTLFSGYMAIKSGVFKEVLVIGVEKMTHRSTEENTFILREALSKEEIHFYGSMPILAALVTNRCIYEGILDEKVLDYIAYKNHKNGLDNPYAHIRKKVDMESISDSKIIAYPLRLYHIAPISDGAAVLILSSEKQNIKVLSMGAGVETVELSRRKNICSFSSTVYAANMAFKGADITPRDIDFAELHDAFVSFEALSLLDIGFVDVKDLKQFILSGEIDKTGSFPVNSSGGLKSRGHPIGASGVAQVVELYRDLLGVSGRGLNGRYALAMSIGGLGDNNVITILEKV